LSQSSDQVPSEKELRHLAEDLVEGENTMTLATADSDVAWAAPVYYVFHKSAFYFFSDPASRHIQEAVKGGRASSSIHAAASTWKEIRGVQMSGSIQPVSAGLEAAQCMRAYLRKFPFTKEFFGPDQDMDLDGFSKRFRVRLYKFVPTLVYYLDNQIRFGFRGEVSLLGS
jgi:uncharacterized protein YhbP (UPF0306 family)